MKSISCQIPRLEREFRRLADRRTAQVDSGEDTVFSRNWPQSWDEARNRPLWAPNSYSDGGMVLLEPGIRFLAHWIHRFGGWTRFSCEGHAPGDKTYVTFQGPIILARNIYHTIAESGPSHARWEVEMWDGGGRLRDGWSISLVRRGWRKDTAMRRLATMWVKGAPRFLLGQPPKDPRSKTAG